MTGQQLLSTDPAAGLVSGVHPEATMRAPAENEPVTVGELMDNPREGLARIGAQVKRDASDPKTWLSLAAMYFGPKVLPKVIPVLTQTLRSASGAAMRGANAVGDVVSPDVIGVISPRAGKAFDVALKMRDAARAKAASAAAPVPEAAAPAAPSAPNTLNQAMEAWRASVASPGTDAPPASAPAAPAAPESPASARPAPAEPSPSAKLQLTAPEMKVFQQLLMQGKTLPQAREAILVQRSLLSSGAFGALPTPAEVARSVAERNATGRWK